jgi:YesN/AraC family two-component response regulator
MKRVLIVDDNVMMRRLIINLFNKDEISFDEACEGKEGLDKISHNSYDLVITDIVMPGMEGIEMIMQAKRSFPGIKIIAISGGKPFYLTLAKKLGIQGILTKPLERKGFVEAVSHCLYS